MIKSKTTYLSEDGNNLHVTFKTYSNNDYDMYFKDFGTYIDVILKHRIIDGNTNLNEPWVVFNQAYWIFYTYRFFSRKSIYKPIYRFEYFDKRIKSTLMDIYNTTYSTTMEIIKEEDNCIYVQDNFNEIFNLNNGLRTI